MSIDVIVDAANPGQFFACCGLLELADRMWPCSEVLGEFSSGHFHLLTGSAERSLKLIIERFVAADLHQLDPEDNAASPLFLGDPFNLRLDWWKKVENANKTIVDLGGGHQLKPWAGRQSGPLIFRLMKRACADIDLRSPLDYAWAVYDTTKDGNAKKKTISPFYFNARRAETSLDIGFSPDEQEMSVMEYPAVESFALVGLQRFRPKVDESVRGRTFTYTAWAEPLPAVVAMAAMTGILPVRSCGTFRFAKPSRGGEYAAMFSRATPVRSNHVGDQDRRV